MIVLKVEWKSVKGFKENPVVFEWVDWKLQVALGVWGRISCGNLELLP